MTQLLLEPLITEERFEPRDWQKRDLSYLGPMPYSANWSQMGCYKTSTGLWLLEKKKVRNALIITSKVGKGSYFSDFYRCLPEAWQLYNVGIGKTTLRINNFEKKVDLDELLTVIQVGKHNHPKVLLIHYDVLTKRANDNTAAKDKNGHGIVDKLRKIEWDMILCDEAHRLKNPDTQWTRNIKRLKAKNKHIMTGTGFVNNPSEIWSLLNFLNKDRWGSYWAFRNYFCNDVISPQGFRIMIGLKKDKVEEFRDLRKSLGPRHTMAKVHRGIKKPIETVHEVELGAVQKKMYNEIKTVLQTMDQQGITLQSPNVLSQLNRLRQICVATPKVLNRTFQISANRMVYDIELVEPSSKLDEVMTILGELDEPDQKVVVFSNFKDPLKLLERRLDKANIPYIHMEQHHSEGQRYKLWHDDFRSGDARVFLSTLALGGESINLSAAQYLIFLDRSWSPKDMMQAIGRVYRPGQEGAVEVIYINAKNTVDSYIKARLTTKNNWFQEIFHDEH